MNIIKYVHLNKVDPDKFLTIKVAILEFKKSNGRRMSLEELTDFCKLEFEDFKFIDTLIHFYRDPSSGKEAQNDEKGDEPPVRDQESDNHQLEKPYTNYASIDQITRLYDILVNLYLLIPREKVFSHSSFMKMLNPENDEKQKHTLDSVANIIDEDASEKIRQK